MAVLEVRELSLNVPGRQLLEGVDLAVDPGECVALLGSSGVGKTSLLNCLAGISAPSGGSVRIDDHRLDSLRPSERSFFRLRNIGIVFQFGELFPELTAQENVALPLRLMGSSRADADKQAASWVARVGMSDHAQAHPETLSGGEIQRIAIARALAHEPQLVLADEPTGMLDEDNTRRVIQLLVDTVKDVGAAALIATHDLSVASMADRSYRLHGGTLTQAPSVDHDRETAQQ